jgi:undecaprenyl-diphosphatase
MLEQLILGIIQGVAEWLPVSSEGLIFLVKTNFFQESDISVILESALFLHLGTFLAALVYFRRKVWRLLRTLFKYKGAGDNDKRILNFLIIATFISSVLGYGLYIAVENSGPFLDMTSNVITLGIGILLLVTAGLQYRAQKNHLVGNNNLKNYNNLSFGDGFILGFVQSLAALPGLSRSGLTVSALLLRKFNDNIALELSFLLSLPIVLGGNIVLNLDKLSFAHNEWIGLLASFVFGLLTIDLLLRLARKINFAHFVLFFGVLTILAAVI